MILTIRQLPDRLRIGSLKRYDEFNAFHSERLDGGVSITQRTRSAFLAARMRQMTVFEIRYLGKVRDGGRHR